MAQYIRENGLKEKTGVSVRHLAQSLLMSTAEPVYDASTKSWYSILRQGAGLANVSNAIHAESYVLVNGQPDGKVKVELGDDPDRTGVYSADFTLNNLTDEAIEYTSLPMSSRRLRSLPKASCIFCRRPCPWQPMLSGRLTARS